MICVEFRDRFFGIVIAKVDFCAHLDEAQQADGPLNWPQAIKISIALAKFS